MRLFGKDFFDMKRLLNFIYYFIILSMLFFVCICILYNAEWILGDDIQFLDTTAINKPIKAWSGGGRYWPLGFFDYNLLLFIPYGYTSSSHYVYCTIIFLIFSVFFLQLLKQITKNIDKYTRHIIVAFYFITLISASGFLRIHTDVIFPERIVITLLTIFMFCYFIALRTQDTKYYVIAFLSASYVTYCKEPMFGVFIVIALTNLLFGSTEKNRNHRFFNYALVINAVIYLLQWYFISFCNSTKCYQPIYGDNRAYQETISSALNNEYMLIPILVLFLFRLYSVLLKKDDKNLCFDGLLFAAVAYSFALMILKLDAGYYFVPSVLLAIPSFSKWTCYFIEKGKKRIAVSIMIVVSFSIIMNFPTIKDRLEIIQRKRKHDMKTVEMIVDLIKSKTPIYFCNNPKLDSVYLKNMWEKFIEYKIDDKFVIQDISNLFAMPDNVVILYPTTLDKKDYAIISDLIQKKFKFIVRAGVTDIYVK